MEHKHKIGKWEYNYLAPEDFDCTSIYPEETLSRLWKAIESASLKNPISHELFKAIIVKSAYVYCCQEYFRGSDSLSFRDINTRIANIKKSAEQLNKRLFPLPLELFEDFVESLHPREDSEGDYDLQDVSLYAQCRINDSMGLPVPTVRKFYENHSGYWEVSGLLARLENDLNTLLEICDSHSFLTETWEHERSKNMGVQRMALHNYTYHLALLWEYCTDSIATMTRNDDDQIRSKCLDFIEAAFTPLEAYYRAKINPEKEKRNRAMLYTCLDQYRKDERGKRRRVNTEILLETLLERLSIHKVSHS